MTPATPRYDLRIQGMRMVAVIMVLLYHAEVPGFSGGFIGVDSFFCISGFVVTGMLSREKEATGTLDLPAFYGSRFKRLLPQSSLVVCMVHLSGNGDC